MDGFVSLTFSPQISGLPSLPFTWQGERRTGIVSGFAPESSPSKPLFSCAGTLSAAPLLSGCNLFC
ncbi:MAG: hypothetical protein P4N59_01505 [Negativicutes bacterium]|nr:hypothetical protein [Negativicutes bacterium]